MTNRGTIDNRHFPALLICLVLLAGCADGCASSGQVSPEARAVSALKNANTVYSEILIATGAAHAAGVITTAQKDRVEQAAQPVYAALVSARSALILYLSVQSQDPSDLTGAIGEVSAALKTLMDVAKREGVQ